MTTDSVKSLADKIDNLFDLVRREDGQQFTHEEVASKCREITGESFSASYLWQLRCGKRDNPTKKHLEALAEFFDVPPAYFFSNIEGKAIELEVELLHAIKKSGVKSLALRATRLSQSNLETILDLVNAIVAREKRSDHKKKD